MSINIQRLVWKTGLPATTKTVLLRLGDHSDDSGGSIYPAVGSLARACGRCERSVQRALRDLERLGVIVLLGGGAGGRGITRRYKIDRAKLRELSREKGDKKGDNVTPFPVEKRVTLATERVTPATIKGDTVSPEPSITTKEPYTDGFAEFWEAYPPRHPHPNPRLPALEKYRAARKNGADPAKIINGARNYRVYVERHGTEPQFIAQAKTWLRQQRWKDHQEAPAPAQAVNPQARDLDYGP